MECVIHSRYNPLTASTFRRPFPCIHDPRHHPFVPCDAASTSQNGRDCLSNYSAGFFSSRSAQHPGTNHIFSVNGGENSPPKGLAVCLCRCVNATERRERRRRNSALQRRCFCTATICGTGTPSLADCSRRIAPSSVLPSPRSSVQRVQRIRQQFC